MFPPSSPPPDDVARSGWAALTVRVAWALLVRNVKLKPSVLRAVREHVLFQLPPDLALADAEETAEQLVAGFLDRVRRRGGEADPAAVDVDLSRCRRAVDAASTPVGEVVLVDHFGDRRPLDAVEHLRGVDRLTLEAARAGLREVVRSAGGGEAWPIATVDRRHGLRAPARPCGRSSPAPTPPTPTAARAVPGRSGSCALGSSTSRT